MERFEPWVDANEIAAHLKITKYEVLANTRAGKLPGHPLDPQRCRKTWRYKISEVDAYLTAQSASPKAAPSKDYRRSFPVRVYNYCGNPVTRKAQKW